MKDIIEPMLMECGFSPTEGKRVMSMTWDTFWLVANKLFYPAVTVLFLGGLFQLLFGIRQRHKRREDTHQIPWYNDPTILEGIYPMAGSLFFCCWVTGTHIANILIMILLDIAALLFFGLTLLSMQRAYKYRALRPPKRLKRQMEEVPRQQAVRSGSQPKEAREEEQGPIES